VRLVRLQDKIAIVTGAASGIGRAIAVRFAAEGARVVIDDVNDQGGEETAGLIRQRGGDAVYVHADVSQPEDVAKALQATVSAYGDPHILVNSAICSREAIFENRWTPIVEIGLHGTWQFIEAVLPGMRKMGTGSIVNISSVNALMGFGREHVYSGSKAAMIGLSRSLCGEVGKHGIRVNCICPGTVLTDIWKPLMERDPGLVDRLKALYPLGRLGQPEDIAYAALFLASDEASFVTGAVFVIDGGISAAQLGFQV
jgi:NAD(P)-dependent dehydrogenase (short-subunit alcohol dehydrogenase family)